LKRNSQFLPPLPLSFDDDEADEDGEDGEVQVVSSKFKGKRVMLSL